MSERWKFQLKNGLPFGIFMSVWMAAWDAYCQSSLAEMYSLKSIARLFIFCMAGVFLLGYYNWKNLQKKK